MDDAERNDAGKALMRQLFAGAPSGGRRLPKEMMRHTVGHVFGDLWQNEDLAVEERSLVTCTILTALGKEAELQLHVRAARNLGIERAKLEAMMIHASHYAGWPTGVAALRILDEVWETMDGEAAADV